MTSTEDDRCPSCPEGYDCSRGIYYTGDLSVDSPSIPLMEISPGDSPDRFIRVKQEEGED
jgi:hypothetical protein